MAGKAEECGDLRAAGGGRSRPVTVSAAEALPWGEQLAIDDGELPRPARLPPRALGVLPREARRGRLRRPRGRRRAGRDRARFRSPRRTSSASRRRRAIRFGAHLCAEPAEIVRIYSTSGTTGTPSYIPLTAADLDNWVDGLGAELRRVRRRRRRAASSRPTTPARSWPARRSPRSSGSASATSRSGPGTPSG